MLYAPHLAADAATARALAPAVSNWLKSMGQRIGAMAATCADYWSAAAVYDELRGLSDTELRRRGLSRDTLARDICNACDRSAGH